MAGGSCDLPPAGVGAWRGPTDNRERHTARRYRLLPRRGLKRAAPPLTPAGEEPRVRVLSLPTPRFQALGVRLGDLVRLGVTPAGKLSLLGAICEEE